MNQWDCLKQGKLHTFLPPFASLSGQIFSRANEFPDKPALVSTQDNVSLSYNQLATSLEQFAGFLKEHNIKKGDAVSFLMENTPEILIMEWSAWSYGFVTVPLDSKRDTLERKIYKLQLARAKALFVRDGLLSEEEKHALVEAVPELSIIEIKSFSDFLSLIGKSQRHTLEQSELDSDCLLLYTSGTTALPKGARLTLRSLWADADQIVQWLHITDADRFFIVLPLHHINSTVFSLATIIAGGTVVLAPKYSKSAFWRAAAEYGITISSIVPTIAVDLLSEQETFERYKDFLKQVSRIQIGSAPVQPTVVKQFYNQYGIRFVQGYGSTETSLRCLGVPSEVSEIDYQQLVESNAAGAELAHNNVTVLRADGSEADEGEDGEICVRGPIIMRGYKDNHDATNEAFQYGWFHVGDVGYYKMYHDQKLFFLKGRSKELIIKGGTNISPLAVEDAVLRALPELFFCYAVGFPDHRLGETIGVVVDGPQHVLDRLDTSVREGNIPGLSSFEQPSAMIRLEEGQLPKTSSGKVQRIDIGRQYGTRLQKESLTVVKTKDYSFRMITPSDTHLFLEMVEIYNSRWPQALHVDESVIRDQVGHGVVIGMFTHDDQLVGYITGVLFHEQALLDRQQWIQTWNGMTGNGRFSTHTQKGDALMCVGITIKRDKKADVVAPSALQPVQLTEKQVEEYIRSGHDPIMRFHQTPKAGLVAGAEIIQIVPRGRPDDSEAFGYNVILKYPELLSEPTVNETASRGVQLIEAALLFAHKHKKKVYVYSRPSGLAQFFVTRSTE